MKTHAGIGAALHLQSLGHEVVLLEARERIGGRAYTNKEYAHVPVETL